MDFLKAEIERKKKEKLRLEEELKNKNANGTTTTTLADVPPTNGEPKKKYVKRGEVERMREQQYLEEIEKEKQAREAKKPKVEEKPKEDEENQDDESFVSRLPIEEIFKRLRARGEPVTLFGETDIMRAKRLHLLEEREPLEYVRGAHDDFGRTLRQLDDNEEDSKKKSGKKRKEAEVSTVSNQPTTTSTTNNNGAVNHKDSNHGTEGDHHTDLKKEMDGNNNSVTEINDNNNVDIMKKVVTMEPSIPATKESFVLNMFKRLLKDWEEELQDRSELVKRSAQGRIDTVTFKQTKKNIKTLFKLLKKRALADDLLIHIHTIASSLRDKEYVKAHDAYLRMAIGNAPWPMGVTMVGIHERSAREKIFSNQVAHVLNDEVQRKYIQSVKRLMTFCQKKYPTDPSKTVG